MGSRGAGWLPAVDTAKDRRIAAVAPKREFAIQERSRRMLVSQFGRLSQLRDHDEVAAVQLAKPACHEPEPVADWP